MSPDRPGRRVSEDVSANFDADRSSVERRLDEICDDWLGGITGPVAEAVRYGIKSPGKRIRPLVLLTAYRAAGGGSDASLLACAPEVIHAYSLMHDDLPCMDDDAMRRGRPTTHKVYGVGTTVRAGVAMIPLAARIVRTAAVEMGMQRSAVAMILETLLEAAGAGGMIGGQLRDLAGEGLALSLQERELIHSAKTGALIVASVRMGAMAAGADAADVVAFERYGRAIGLAFQIMDDVLDVTSSSHALGKNTGRDAAHQKSSYPALLGVDAARQRAESLVHSALEGLASRELLTQELSQVANFMVTRTS